MGHSGLTERRRGGRRTALMNFITRLMTTSLAFYIVAVLVQRTWAVLNLDVVELIRRL